MPYIGQRPATGEANSFKILDDISNYTLTFGSSDIDVSTDTITAREHRFVTGQRVTYGNGGGTDPTGLSNGTVYYIIVEDRHTFKLAANASNAVAGTAIDITAAGAGAAHTINVTFDGVNTKFKATHTNGTKADITQSGQLMVSVNGVLQQPHDNTTTPSTGYATDHTSTIIFSAAPAAGDQFFGRLIASNFATFDISDNTVDNFTGDGSTSTFTLSKAPPNNESVLVTIDGVVQYPDDNAAVRAYTVSENILDFASAPGNAVEIQVRHIGFAGASTGGISGFYGRTGNAVLKSTDNIVFNNATASGTVQAANVTVTGNLTVDGTTTTLDTDLIGVDKLEVSANNTTVGAAITQSGTGDILNLYDGSTEVFSVTDGGKVLIGTQTEGDGSADNLTIADSGNSGITIRSGTSNQGSIFFSDATSGSGEYDGFIQYSQNDRWLKFGTATSTRLTISSGGYIGINEVNPTQQLHVHDDTNYQGILINGSSAPRLTFAKSGSTTVEWGVGIDGTNGNNFAIAQAGNTAKFIIDANGKIGINDNTPDNTLSIKGLGSFDADSNSFYFGSNFTGTGQNYIGSSKHAQRFFLNNASANGYFSYSNTGSAGTAGDAITWQERFRITSDGKVGIGTVSPTDKLSVYGGTASVWNTNTNNRVWNAGTTNGHGLMKVFRSNGEVFFRVDSDAKEVGIGTDNPRRKLHVSSSGTDSLILVTGTTPQIRLNSNVADSSDNDRAIFGLATANGHFFSTAVAGDTAVRTTNGGNLCFGEGTTERVRIDSAGRLLIGRTSVLASSSERFTVDSGMGIIRNNSTSTAALYLRNEDSTADTRHPYLIFADASGNRGGIGIQNDSSSLWISGQNGIAFRTSGSAPSQQERLRIETNGEIRQQSF